MKPSATAMERARVCGCVYCRTKSALPLHHDCRREQIAQAITEAVKEERERLEACLGEMESLPPIEPNLSGYLVALKDFRDALRHPTEQGGNHG